MGKGLAVALAVALATPVSAVAHQEKVRLHLLFDASVLDLPGMEEYRPVADAALFETVLPDDGHRLVRIEHPRLCRNGVCPLVLIRSGAVVGRYLSKPDVGYHPGDLRTSDGKGWSVQAWDVRCRGIEMAYRGGAELEVTEHPMVASDESDCRG